MDGAPFDVSLFEGCTASCGTSGALNNMDRTSARTPKTTISQAPTVTDTGTEITYAMISGTGQSGGQERSPDTHWKLKPNTKYLLRITNNSGNNRSAGVTLKVIEPPEILASIG